MTSVPSPTHPTGISLRALRKTYQQGSQTVRAIDGIDLDLPPGTFTAVVGPSGSGKSTLVHCAAGLEEASSGRILLAGTEISAMSRDQRAEHRARMVGFVFQEYNLVSSLTARQNVALPGLLRGAPLPAQSIDGALDRVGLTRLSHRRPHQLSGGERQRVAVARVLAAEPGIVFADEPTGALDIASAEVVLEWLASMPATVVMVTHDPHAAARADRVLVLGAGRLHSHLPGGDSERIAAAVLSAQETRP